MRRPPEIKTPALLQTAQYFWSPPRFAERYSAELGDIFSARVIGFGDGDWTFVNAPEDLRAVFTADADVLHAGEANALLGRILGDHSVLVLDGAPHLRQRKLLLPPFHGERMLAYSDVMREETERAMSRWVAGEPFAMMSETQKITLEVILRTVFGVDSGEQQAELARAISKLLETLEIGWMVLGVITRALPPRMRRAKEEVDRLLFAQIRRRRADPHLERRSDVLSMLLLARDEEGCGMSDQELRDELMTLLAAGHETTATALAWAIRELLARPDVRAKVERELEDIAGKSDGVDSASIPRLEYLDATVKESLRRHPVIFDVGRRVKKPFQLRDFDIPIGNFVAPCIWLTHKRRDLYPEPTIFRPERFLGKKIDPYEWLPFGGGIRRCIGASFALWEMKVVLATILRGVELELATNDAVRESWHSITLAPSDGTRVVMKRRRAKMRFTGRREVREGRI